MTTPTERTAAQRQAKLDEVERQLRDGSLKIRKMTDEERRRYPPRPPRPPRGRRK